MTAETPAPQPATGYCLKCREQVTIQNPENTTYKNGRRAIRGNCPKCNTKISRIGGK